MSARRDAIEVAARLGKLGLRGEDAAALIRISRSLSRIGERQCNGDTSCNACEGTGRVLAPEGIPIDDDPARPACKPCGGAGDILGKREASLIRKAEAIAEIWGLKVYHQGDPRGAALYIYSPDALARFETQGFKGGIACCYSSVGTAIY